MTSPRWSDYYIRNDYEQFWRERLADKDASVCIILGVGFDPRSLVALKQLARSGSHPQIKYVAILLHPPEAINDVTRRTEAFTKENRRRLEEFRGGTCICQEEVPLRDKDGFIIGGRNAVQMMIRCLSEIAACKDVIVDISGLPRTFFFPLIKYLYRQTEKGKIKNLHVAVTEDPSLDGKIHGSEYGEAEYIPYFRPQTAKKLVWLPVIGKTEPTRLLKIYTQIESECVEVCPIIPFPAKNMRRADDILVELRDALFAQIYVSRNNILLCDESSPFDIYRKVVEMDDYYKERLKDLPGIGEVTAVVTPLASKMLSLGALLAAIERDLPVSYIEAGSYYIEAEGFESSGTNPEIAPVEVWLTGEPYEVTSSEHQTTS